jgi:hypothetical protein
VDLIGAAEEAAEKLISDEGSDPAAEAGTFQNEG